MNNRDCFQQVVDALFEISQFYLNQVMLKEDKHRDSGKRNQKTKKKKNNESDIKGIFFRSINTIYDYHNL